MSRPQISIDSSVVIDVLRKQPESLKAFERLKGSQFLLCPIVDFEVRRKIYADNARVQLKGLNGLVRHSMWLDLTPAVTDLAANTWADLRREGVTVADADILISCHAAVYGAVVWTKNLKDFERLPASVLKVP